MATSAPGYRAPKPPAPGGSRQALPLSPTGRAQARLSTPMASR
ncbi:hypothetical protein [Halomonas sp. 707D4]|nr:hypothetical protein [Halomonas sp. 707D4]